MKGIRKRVVFHFSIIILMIVLLLEGLFIAAVRQYYFGTATQTLISRATTSTAFYNKYLDGDSLKSKAKYILENLAEDEFAKIEIIDWQGNVILDSYGFSAHTRVTAPDVTEAIAGHTGVWIGRNPITQERVIAVSNPLKYQEKILGVLRYTVSAEMLYEMVSKITVTAIAIGLLVIILSFLYSLLSAQRIIDPIGELTHIANQMAKGNFSARATKRHGDEVGMLAETLNYMAQQLSKNEKLKNDFISSVSHELRTPLTSIKGWSETLVSGNLEDKEETMLGLQVITKETERLIGLVEELLDFSKFQSGEMKIQQQTVNISRLLAEIGRQFGVTGQHKGVWLEANIPEEPLCITGDQNRLKQVFVNLLDNAFKFTGANGLIRLAAAKNGREVWISVEDNGEGIAPEDLPKVTEKFYKGRSKHAGSGLGLSICKEIVQLHGGVFQIESSLGKGTKVSVMLPLQSGKRPAAEPDNRRQSTLPG
jgi:signal transduction histidine kinase